MKNPDRFYRTEKVLDLDPLDVFQRVARTGRPALVSAYYGMHPRSLNKKAHAQARRGEFALLFALEAGKHMHLSLRARRVVRRVLDQTPVR